MGLRPYRPENLPRTSETWAPNKGPNSPLWCQRCYGKEEQNRSFMTSIVALNRGCFFLHILPSCRQHPAEQTERKISGKGEISFSDLGGFVEQERGTQWQNLKCHLYCQEKRDVPRCTCPCCCPNFQHNQTRLSVFWRLCCAAAPGVAQQSRDVRLLFSNWRFFSLITDVLQATDPF